MSLTSPIGVAATSVATMSPFSSAIVCVTAIENVWPPALISALYLEVPAFRSTEGFGAPTAAGSTFFARTTVFGSTVISFSRAATSGVAPSW